MKNVLDMELQILYNHKRTCKKECTKERTILHIFLYEIYIVCTLDRSDKAFEEKYSRGRRGAPAKGVGRVNRRGGSNPPFSVF